MKKRNRILALFLSLAMMLTFMPALAFAEGEGGGEGSDPWEGVDFGKLEYVGEGPEDVLYSDGVIQYSYTYKDAVPTGYGISVGLRKEGAGETEGEWFSVDTTDSDVAILTTDESGESNTLSITLKPKALEEANANDKDQFTLSVACVKEDKSVVKWAAAATFEYSTADNQDPEDYEALEVSVVLDVTEDDISDKRLVLVLSKSCR